MSRFMILPYTAGSKSAKEIAEAVDGLRIKLENSTYKYKEGDLVINWGNGHPKPGLKVPKEDFLNQNINICIDKREFFLRMEGKNITPAFATSREEARRHLKFPVVCRTQLEGADGQGIVIAEKPEDLVPAKLYTQLVETNSNEYRIHAGRRFKGDIIFIAAQKKRWVAAAREKGLDPRIMTGEHVVLDWTATGTLPLSVRAVVQAAMNHMPELTFGGFDVVVGMDGFARVVEVNSAPMMTPDTAKAYAKFFTQYVADRDAAKPKPAFKVPAPVVKEAVAMQAIPGKFDGEAFFADLQKLIVKYSA